MAILRVLLLTSGVAMAAYQMPVKYKEGGTALPNTCATWKYGTAGRIGEAVNPFCKSTESDMGTTGTVHLTAVPSEAHSFTQDVQFSVPNAYKMTTTYWGDSPCQSGEEFIRCPAAGRSGSTYTTTGCNSCTAGDKYCEYTTSSCTSAGCQCKAKCCFGECPKKTCMRDTHDQCPSNETAYCPMWPLCITYGTCDSGSSADELKCVGLAGARPRPCAAVYPGCGAVNDYVAKGIGYPTQTTQAGGATGAVVNVMTIEATGTVEDITDLNNDGAVNSADTVVKMTELCGAQNNIFSYSEAGTLDLLANAAINPTLNEDVSSFGLLTSQKVGQSCCSEYVDSTGTTQSATSACPANQVDKCTCVAAHPDYCECSKLAKITLTSLKVTARASGIKTQLGQCSSCSTDGGSAGSTLVKDLINCNLANCPILSSIGYDQTSVGNTATHQTYYMQYHRPNAAKNALYLGTQTKDLTAALAAKVHAEGVYSMDTVCGTCGLRPGLTTLVLLVAAALALWWQ